MQTGKETLIFVREQTLLSQYMSLWFKDYFRLIILKKQKTQEALLFASSLPWASLVGQLVKNPPVMWETWV